MTRLAGITLIALYLSFFAWIGWSYYTAYGTDITAWMLG